jgi:hypothetical protein
MPADRIFRPDMHVRVRLQKLGNTLIVNREIAIVEDDESEFWPYSRKHMIACTAVAHGINKETTGLKNFWSPFFFNEKLPFWRARCIHPYMFLGCLISIQYGIVAQ